MWRKSNQQEKKIGGFDETPVDLDFSKTGNEFVEDAIKKLFGEDVSDKEE